MHVQRSSICCSLCLPPKFTSRTVHSRRHAAALSCRRLRFACTAGQQWAPQNLDLYESGWLSLTGYSQCYFPEWLTMMAASLARAASQRSGSTDQLTAAPETDGIHRWPVSIRFSCKTEKFDGRRAITSRTPTFTARAYKRWPWLIATTMAASPEPAWTGLHFNNSCEISRPAESIA